MNYYDKHASSFIRESVNLDMLTIYTPFINLLPSNASILDIGCGSGRDLLFFKQNNYSVTGLDSSQAMVNSSRELANCDVFHCKIEDFQPITRYHGIWACASLLHIEPDQMSFIFHKISTMLHKKGIFYSSFKYGEGQTKKNKRIFTNFTEKSFASLLEKLPEYKMISQQTTPDLRPEKQDHFWLNTILIKD